MARTRKLRLKGGGPTKPKNVKAKTFRSPAERAATYGTTKKEEKVAKLRTNLQPIESIETESTSTLQTDSCTNAVNKSWMAYHLKADIMHDFGEAFFIEARSEEMMIGDTPPFGFKEEVVKNNFLNLFPTPHATFRKDNQLNFQIAQKTDFFPQTNISSVFKPFPTVPDKNIGVVQDAGMELYSAIGATNLLTFGSILDQAGKPRENAYYVNVPTPPTTLKFELCVFGFNPVKVKEITISNFNGNSVKCKFTSNFGEGGSGDTPIELNKRQGDFKSIAEVRALTDENDKYRGIIGKALGDALQVASLVQEIGGVVNPYYPIGKSARSLTNERDTRMIQKVIFNTGDRLAHTRAYAFGVPSVYSSPRDKNTGIRTFEYIPGVDVALSEDYFKNYYTNSMNNIRTTIDKSYSDLLTHLRSFVLGGKGEFNPEASKYDDETLIKADRVDIATQYIQRLITNIERIKEIVKQYCEGSPFDKPSQETYNTLLKESIHLMPSSATTLARGDRRILLTLTLLKPREDITLKSTGEKLLDKGTYTWNIYETYKKIRDNVPIDGKQMKVFTMFGNDPPLPNVRAGGSKVGGQKVEEIFGIPFSSQTMTLDLKDKEGKEPDPEFIEQSYLPEASGMTWKKVYEAYETYRKYPASIIDETLFQSLFNEYASIVGESNVFVFEDYKKGVSPVHSIQSLTFNEFACRFNATIAGEDTDFGKELLDYSAKFKKLMEEPLPATAATKATDVVSNEKDGVGSDGATFNQANNVTGSPASSVTVGPFGTPPPSKIDTTSRGAPSGTAATETALSAAPVGTATSETSPMSMGEEDEDGNVTGTDTSTNKERKSEVGKKMDFSQQGEGYKSADLDEDTHGGGLDLEHSFVKKVGGQRVDREKFSIDETKSFVKVGGYPSSDVK